MGIIGIKPLLVASAQEEHITELPLLNVREIESQDAFTGVEVVFGRHYDAKY